jgi:hypothetical protein
VGRRENPGEFRRYAKLFAGFYQCFNICRCKTIKNVVGVVGPVVSSAEGSLFLHIAGIQDLRILKNVRKILL